MFKVRDTADANDNLSYAQKTNRNLLRQPIWLHKNKEDAKSWAEISYARRLALALGYQADQVNFTKPDDVHPDVCMELNSDFKIGIEVTELLDRTTLLTRLGIAKSENRLDPSWKLFSEAEYVKEIRSCIAKKSKKLSWASKFTRKWLLITTAEPDLAFGSKCLNLKLADGIGSFDKVYIVGEAIPSANCDLHTSYTFGEITALDNEV